MFDKNNALVKIWVRNVENGNRSRDEVPNLENLREVVLGILTDEIT